MKPEDTGTNTLLSLYVHFPTMASRPEDHSRKPEIWLTQKTDAAYGKMGSRRAEPHCSWRRDSSLWHFPKLPSLHLAAWTKYSLKQSQCWCQRLGPCSLDRSEALICWLPQSSWMAVQVEEHRLEMRYIWTLGLYLTGHCRYSTSVRVKSHFGNLRTLLLVPHEARVSSEQKIMDGLL